MAGRAPASDGPGATGSVAGLPAEARAAVLAWFEDRGRALAFRATRDPYAILVSEVMAQQTQVSRVVEAWARFLERFPTVAALAAASPADVLRAWQGMGYDRRALNLRRAARAIESEHGGIVPSEVAALERLPGIGPYTARAIASIAFGQAVGAVDTNVRRVIGRSLAGTSAPPAVWLQAAADASVEPTRPGAWTHAVMDIGATLCRPRAPACGACPLRTWCRTAAGGSTGGPMAESPPPRARDRARAIPFPATTRWLRGRIVDRLRSAEGDTWIEVSGPFGEHGAAAVRDALDALARDGVIERARDDAARVRLSTADTTDTTDTAR